MDRCPSCSAAIGGAMRFCPSCGAPLDPPLDAPTIDTSAAPADLRVQGRGAAASAPGRDRAPSIGRSTPAGRFAPGTVLSARYRIVGLLGRGGMGEIYRADDLKLDQPVALKFLPPHLASDSARLEALYREVRVARQVSHANVCRTYDIGEMEGLPFITMEYVDGEDLSSLLRRIGRLPGERAIEIARQICAGLAAAHDRGVLHRDLKPSNVMIDGEGRVRITDFGLAGLQQDFQGEDIRSGTPAYMAPEQLAGTEVSVRSDLYALGLVLYEMFTGKAAFRAKDPAELMRMQRDEPPTRPSALVPEIDPAVERVILRCLEKDARLRPTSALAVAAALPGGDPLAAALAAGETPSPELVAAAGEEGTIRPALGWLALAGIALAFVMMPMLLSGALYRRVPLEKPPILLVERAREIASDLGYTQPPHHAARGFATDLDLLAYVRKQPSSPHRWSWLGKGRPAAIYFWYRQSPREMVPRDVGGAVTLVDPPEDRSGMLSVLLDPVGRLIEFHAVPPQVDDSLSAAAPAVEPDWNRLFQAAGLDLGAFKPTRPQWIPFVFADTRSAWEGPLDSEGRFPVRIEAAAFRGKPVYFDIVGAWSRPAREVAFVQGRGQRVSQAANLVLVLIGLFGAALQARRNLRLGRGDRRGAIRLAAYFAVVTILQWALTAAHSRDFTEEWQLFAKGAGQSLFLSLIVWTLYLALEPLVRRRWPDLIISWMRVVSGRWRDPLAGRDVLVGAAFGAVAGPIELLQYHLFAWLGGGPESTRSVQLGPLLGIRYLADSLLGIQTVAIVNAIFFLFLPLGLVFIVRKEWIALGLSFLIITLLAGFQGDNVALSLAGGALQVAILFFVARRFGLLASASCFFYFLLLNTMPLTLNLSEWYASGSTAALAVGLLIAIGAFRVARRRPARI